jgi:DNA polymerase-4
MDAFYASVEQRDNPELRGKPLVVGGSTNRGVVAAASYESREYGIRSAMPMAEAARRCPDLVRVSPRMPAYRSVSREVFGVFAEFTPLVEGLSLDEAFLDVSASLKLFGAARDIAVAIKERIREHMGLTASVGVAENKLVAKIASDLDKPDGLTVVMPGDYRRVLDPLPVSVIPGIGRETLARLRKLDIRTVAGLRVAARTDLQKVFGRFADSMQARAAGIDDRPVVPAREEKSISAEETYGTDLVRRVEMEKQLLRLADKVAGRLRKAGLCASTIQVKIRQADFSTFTRQKTLSHASNSTDGIYSVARKLLGGWMEEHRGARVRLLGVGGSNLEKVGQADLFAADGDRGSAPLDSMVDEIRDRFGAAALERARTMDKS